ncbi:MAG: hypothetical protein Q9181_005552, partial [Wetmoreana brouardii]
ALICEAVKCTRGQLARSIVKDMTDLAPMYNALKRQFKPKKSDELMLAFRQFQDLRHDGSQGVSAYAKKFKHTVKELEDRGCVLPQTFVNAHFVNGLSSSFEQLLAASLRNNIIMPQPGQQVATLDEAVYLAMAFEQIKRSQQ